jgi:hypothetical protein
LSQPQFIHLIRFYFNNGITLYKSEFLTIVGLP